MSDTTEVVEAGFVSMAEAKKLGTAGLKFRSPTGAVGTVLADRSPKGKLRAELTCTAGGPNHIREVSDWHQCGVSPEMKKGKKKAKKTPTEVVAEATEAMAGLEQKLVEQQVEVGLTTTEEQTTA